MILYVKVTNFRGLEGRFDFQHPTSEDAARHVALRGRNGARKTTVREAVAFAFTGRDSQGSTKPLHLISMGEEACEVEVMTRKGTVIQRTLTRKGGGTLRMAMPGRELQTLTQTDFEAMLCPADVFLSVLVPGYLLGQLPKNRQSAVLSYILPPVDRRALVARVTGLPLDGIAALDYTRRPDLLQKELADRRNALTKKRAALLGEETAIMETLEKRPSEPAEPPEVMLLALQDQLQREWSQYEFEMTRYTSAIHDLRIKRDENVRIRREREEAQAEIERLREIPLPPEPAPFTLEKPEKPAEPFFQNEEERDRCPGCGQTVGLKHREMVRSQNEAIQKRYLEDYQIWREKRKAWDAAKAEHSALLWEFEKKVKEIKEANEKVDTRWAQLDWALQSRLVPHEIPESDPLPPKKPREEFSMERYLIMKDTVEKYHRALGAFESWRELASSGAQRLREISEVLHQTQSEIQYIQVHEEALKVLPDLELMEQKSHLSLPDGYELRVSEGIELFNRHGCPYELLSRGERMHADFEVCLKVNSLLKRKVGMIFLDDFDLADWSDLLKEAPDTVQIFTAHVWAGDLSVGLSN